MVPILVEPDCIKIIMQNMTLQMCLVLGRRGDGLRVCKRGFVLVQEVQRVPQGSGTEI